MLQRTISPIEAVQNSALGALIIWSFCRGYQNEVIGRLPHLHLTFLGLPIVLHSSTRKLVESTNLSSGLGKFIEKLSQNREDLIAVHPRTIAMKTLTLEAISTGIASNLVTVIYEQGVIRANEISVRRPDERIKPLTSSAEKLGRWVARVPPATAFLLLQVSP